MRIFSFFLNDDLITRSSFVLLLFQSFYYGPTSITPALLSVAPVATVKFDVPNKFNCDVAVNASVTPDGSDKLLLVETVSPARIFFVLVPDVVNNKLL